MEALAYLAAGKSVVLVDDGYTQGDLVVAAEHATTGQMSHMIRYGSGFVRVALSEVICDHLRLSEIPGDRVPGARSSGHRVTVDVVSAGTGISASDRGATIRRLAAPEAVAHDFTRPGHVVPVSVRESGVLAVAGRAEAAVDLARSAGLCAAAAYCEIVSEHDPTSLAQGDELVAFAAARGLPLVTIGEIVRYRRRTEQRVSRVADTIIPTAHGVFRAFGYHEKHSGIEHMALLSVTPVEDFRAGRPLFAHVECLTGDIFDSTGCGCASDLRHKLQCAASSGGAVIYLRTTHRPGACGLFESSVGPDAEDMKSIVADIAKDLGMQPESSLIGDSILAASTTPVESGWHTGDSARFESAIA